MIFWFVIFLRATAALLLAMTASFAFKENIHLGVFEQI
jgi:hypothetical protein